MNHRRIVWSQIWGSRRPQWRNHKIFGIWSLDPWKHVNSDIYGLLKRSPFSALAGTLIPNKNLGPSQILLLIYESFFIALNHTLDLSLQLSLTSYPSFDSLLTFGISLKRFWILKNYDGLPEISKPFLAGRSLGITLSVNSIFEPFSNSQGQITR